MPKIKKVIPLAVSVAPHVPGGLYVGIDQSLTGTGVVAFNDKGELIGTELFSTKPGETPMGEVERITGLFSSVHRHILKQMDHMGLIASGQVCVVMEDFAYGATNQMAKMGGLGWHFRIMMSRTPWHFATCPVNVLKQVATGKGNAQKDQVMLGVYKRWQFESDDNNVADAYVLGRIALMAYAKPLPNPTTGIRKDDLVAVSKLTIYR